LEQKFISIILPTYNRASTIINAINSVLKQTYTNFELIVVDDASQDNTGELVEALTDDRIRYIKNEINLGANATRNIGIDASKGDYIAFQDSDDCWRKDKLEKQVNAMVIADENVGVVYTGFNYYKENDLEYKPNRGLSIYDKTKGIYHYLLSINIVSTQTILVKKRCFNVVGNFDINMPRLQDWDLCLRLAREFEFILIDEPLVDVFYTQGSISSNNTAYIRARCLIIKKNDDILADELLFYNTLRELIYFSVEHKILKDGIEIIKEYLGENVINYELLMECMCFIYEKKEKFMMNYSTLNKWFNLKEKDIHIEQYFRSRGYRNIAIYGMGELGRHLYNELKVSKIIIKYGIDKSVKKYQDMGLKVNSSYDCEEPVDAIVVSVVYGYEKIEMELQKNFNGPILSIEKIINELLN
jgi:glycosyltransferase involved in cell wall biosynthesis